MRILVTAGPTREFFDTVRFISNPSTGKMGYSIASEAARRGHDVVLISGPVDLPEPPGVELIRAAGAREMFEAAKARFTLCQAAVMTAAVCDYRPARRLSHKLKKQNRPRRVELVPTEDICAHLGAVKGDRVMVGFALEDRDHRKRAEAKLRRKRCDAMVLNRPANIGGDTARIEILRHDTGWSGPISGTKIQLAHAVVELVENLVGMQLPV